ncbi:MAG: RNA polymerase sigma factor, partial [Gammaproteobacteria bacterium]|nr:RNA polymerase sigma factor [Gammaproteobacteria bacterium]
DDAEEIVQETYTRLLEVPKLDSLESRVRGYAFKIATNLAYDRFRSRQVQGKRVELEDAELSNAELDPGHIVGMTQCLEAIKQTLLELEPRARQVYLLRTAERLTYPQIAERLGISTRTVEREIRSVIDLCQQRLQTRKLR